MQNNVRRIIPITPVAPIVPACPIASNKERFPNLGDHDRLCDSPKTRDHYLTEHALPCHNGETCLAGKTYPEMRQQETRLTLREQRYRFG